MIHHAQNALSLSHTSFSSLVQPLHCLPNVLGYTPTLPIHQAQTKLSPGITLLSGFAIPLHCFPLVLGYWYWFSLIILQLIDFHGCDFSPPL